MIYLFDWKMNCDPGFCLKMSCVLYSSIFELFHFLLKYPYISYFCDYFSFCLKLVSCERIWLFLIIFFNLQMWLIFLIFNVSLRKVLTMSFNLIYLYFFCSYVFILVTIICNKMASLFSLIFRLIHIIRAWENKQRH